MKTKTWAELTYKKDDEEFRPDIILLINGMPLAFIEVKKPNNRDGILAEHKRIQTRFQNKKFRKFVSPFSSNPIIVLVLALFLILFVLVIIIFFLKNEMTSLTSKYKSEAFMRASSC